jgi:hypothetical protein
MLLSPLHEDKAHSRAADADDTTHDRVFLYARDRRSQWLS